MEFLYAGPTASLSGGTLLLAHGAGAAMDSTWMNTFCGLLAERDIRAARFEFSYMAARRAGRAQRAAPR
jgi:predicted alpha/beta-hydrolase family hydrolase